MKRVISALLGMPIVIVIMLLNNIYVVDITFAIVAALALHEFLIAFKEKFKPIVWIGYFAAAFIAVMPFIAKEHILTFMGLFLFFMIILLFIEIFKTNMEINIADISITFFGICYIVFFLMFMPLIYERTNGYYLIWYVFAASWGTDVFAYEIGKRFGKHKFSKISPNKSIEGCIAGIVGAVVLMLLVTILFNTVFHLGISYLYVAFIGVILSIIGQMGDFAASSVKRYTGIKDFGNLIPGHGGMLDRFDSVIFIAPVAYFLLMFI
ncbi:MAG: phosphatidate cytidylyltransferase [Oscillospiraceae bacterium]|nr:phosphatidate cytidylyltransferase [Oscillospiraceae bacterium]